jgi:hypothetical protein
MTRLRYASVIAMLSLFAWTATATSVTAGTRCFSRGLADRGLRVCIRSPTMTQRGWERMSPWQ